MPNSTMIRVGAACLLAGAVAFSAWWLGEAVSLGRLLLGPTVTAHVFEIGEYETDYATREYAAYRFIADGDSFDGWTTRSSQDVGDEVLVRFDPQRPTRNYAVGDRARDGL